MGRWEPDARGRLWKAACELFVEQGFDRTTVAEIADRAGLTERTFFRHFADKREVLFAGGWLTEIVTESVAGAQPGLSAMETVTVAVEVACDEITANPDWSRQRAGIIAGHAELQERELAKMGVLAAAMKDGLLARGVDGGAADLAAELGVLAFRVSYERWAAGPRGRRLAPLVRVVLAELHEVSAGD